MNQLFGLQHRGDSTWVCVYKNTNHVIHISTVNLNQDWQMIEHRLKEIIKEQEQ